MIEISGNPVSLEEFSKIVLDEETVALSGGCRDRCEKGFNFLQDYAKDKVVYGINTGFGPMAQYYIAPEEHRQLQYNLVRSHASGAGDPLSYLQCRALMVARLNSFALGYSGVHPELLDTIVSFINHGIHPYIPEHGGVGASGDLVQLAHLALNLIGEGELLDNGVRRPAAEVLAEKKIAPFTIRGREGLAILNGTSAMTGIGLLNVIHAQRLVAIGITASAVINELVGAFDDHFSESLNAVKPHKGQQLVAGKMRSHLSGSGLIRHRSERDRDEGISAAKFKEKVQEYYSLRCVPQILGPVLDTVERATEVLLNELNSVNDNPVIDVEHNHVYHGGNFHGDYVSLEMDKLRIVLAKLSLLAERQTNYLAADYLNEKFPKFLVKGQPGLNFGIQGMQFTATSTVAENQMLSNSMYVHSIPTNADNQDVVSMGTNAALMTARVVNNCYQVLALEAIALSAAFSFIDKKELISEGTRDYFNLVNPLVPSGREDAPLYKVIDDLCILFKRDRSITLNK